MPNDNIELEFIKFKIQSLEEIARLTQTIFMLTSLLEQKGLLSKPEHEFLVQKVYLKDKKEGI